MISTALLSAVIGAVVGMLGGGGSILLLPVLVYAGGIPTPDAITLSLLVVAVTSLSALPSHAREGRVDVRTGLFVGAGGIAGALLGARASLLLPNAVLLGGFATLMVGTSLRMLRGTSRVADEAPLQRVGVARALGVGVLIGFVSGLVGAGGGFLVVPALVWIGGLTIRTAIGTSLLVIALQSSAGFAMHALHARPATELAAMVTGAAMIGSVFGSRLSGRVPQDKLRRGFAWLVLVAGAVLLIEQVPSARWTAWLDAIGRPVAGGAMIGAAGALLWLLHGRVAGISGISGGLLVARPGDRAWRIWFIGGLFAGGSWMVHALPTAFEASTVSLGTALLAGTLVGVGTTLANGCTSGHGVYGVSRLSRRSLAATATFIAAGITTVYFRSHVL